MVIYNERENQRSFGIDLIGPIAWGTHLCQFYESKQDLIDILVPYFTQGLRNNEFCMWVCSPPLEVDDATAALRQALPDLDHYLQKGQIEIISYKDWYLLGGKFVCDRVLQGWVEKEQAARKNGFDGLRLTGNTFWIERPLWKNFVDYEAAVNAVIGKYRMMALCTYCLKNVSGTDVVDVIKNHAGTLLKQDSKWVLVENAIERKKDEQEIVRAKQEWESTFDSVTDLIAVLDKHHKVVRVNQAMAKQLGVMPEQAVGLECFKVVHGLNQPPAFCPHAKTMKDNKEHTEQVHEPRLDGDFLVTTTPLRNDTGRLIGSVHVARNITESKKAEENILKAKEETEFARKRLETILETTPSAVVIIEASSGKFSFVNKRAMELYGFDTLGLDLESNVAKIKARQADGSSYPIEKMPVSRSLRLGVEVHNEEMIIENAKGRVFPIMASTAPLRDAQGNITAAIVVWEDITERKKSELSLKKSEEQYSSLFSNMASGFAYCKMIFDGNNKPSDFVYLQINDSFEKITGLKRELIIGRKVTEAIPGIKEATPELFVTYGRVAQTRNPEKFEINFTPLHMWLSVSVYSPEKGYFAAVFEDVTEHKKAEEALRKNEAAIAASKYARSLLEASLDPLVTISAEGKITDVNDATVKVTGYSREQLIGSDFSDYFTEPQKAREGYQRVFTAGLVRDYPLAIKSKSGKTTDVLYNATVYYNETGAIKGVFAAARDVTDRKKAEETVQAERKRLFDVLETVPAMVALITPDYHTVFTNRSFRERFGESHGKPCYQYCFGQSEPCKFCESMTPFKTGQPHHWEVKGEDGSVIEAHDYPFTDVDGSPLVLEMDIDITARKRAEDQLRIASQYSRSLLEASLDPLVTISGEGKITDVNTATEAATGYSRQELIGSDFSDYFTDSEKARDGYKRVFTEGYVRDYPLAIRAKSGKITDVLYNATLYRDKMGAVQGVFAAARDVTARKQAEEKLRAASLYARSLLEASLDPLVTISAEGKITDVNKATEEVTGYDREQLIGSDFSDYFTEPEKARRGYQQVFNEYYVQDYPLAIRHKTGRITEVLYNATVYRNEKGQIQGVFAAARDVTARKQAEEKLWAASLYARSLLEASLDPLVTISAQGKITDVNKATEEVTGYSRDQLIGSDFSDYFTQPEQAREGYQKVFSEGFVTDYPLAIRHTSGKITDVLYNATLYTNEAGEVQGVFAAARDITQRKIMENELKETNVKLKQSNAELEQFAYVASHDLQEPLRMVASYVQLIERRYKGKLDPDADEFINYAVDGANRMRGLIDDLLTYSRVGRLGKPFEPTKLGNVMETVLSNLQTSIADNKATVTYDDLPVVLADSGQMVQLFQNLIGNGIKFHRDEPPQVHVSVKNQGSEYQFAVSDNGIGIDSQYYNRLFKIFQRLHTKQEYPGSGIGLVICKKIVERHGGRIWLESELGKGSIVYFTLAKGQGGLVQK